MPNPKILSDDLTSYMEVNPVGEKVEVQMVEKSWSIQSEFSDEKYVHPDNSIVMYLDAITTKQLVATLLASLPEKDR